MYLKVCCPSAVDGHVDGITLCYNHSTSMLLQPNPIPSMSIQSQASNTVPGVLPQTCGIPPIVRTRIIGGQKAPKGKIISYKGYHIFFNVFIINN